MLVISLIPSVLALPENIFIGSSFFEKLPVIEAGKTSDFTIKLFYKNGPYSLENLTAVIDIYPVSLTRFLTIKSDSPDYSVHPVNTVIIHGNITASPDIPPGKTSLVYYFSAKDAKGVSYKSSWNGSTEAIDIKDKSILETLTIQDTKTLTKNSPLGKFRAGIALDDISCKTNHVLVVRFDGTPACVTAHAKDILLQRGWAINEFTVIKNENNTTIGLDQTDSQKEDGLEPLQVSVTGEKQVRRGTTQTIDVHVFRGDYAIPNARVFIDIEDYGEDIIREFKGFTDSQGNFVISWEIPQSFDDLKTLLAIVDVTDNISSKTELFKFQVYCLPGESNCKVKGN